MQVDAGALQVEIICSLLLFVLGSCSLASKTMSRSSSTLKTCRSCKPHLILFFRVTSVRGERGLNKDI